jgi:hypothetical protein
LLAVHAEAAGMLDTDADGVFTVAADLGFDRVGCCGLALYGAHSTSYAKESERLGTQYRIDGGLELRVVAPATDERLTLRLRGGLTSTPPALPRLGREGYTGSAALLLRLWSVGGTAIVSEPSGTVDAALGYSVWAFEHERSSETGGAGRNDEAPSTTHHAFMAGLRIGVDYGIGFR